MKLISIIICINILIILIINNRPSRKKMYCISYNVTFCIYANGQTFNGKIINWFDSNGGEYIDNNIYFNLPNSFFKIKYPSVNQRLSEMIEIDLDNSTHCHGMYGSVVKINKVTILV